MSFSDLEADVLAKVRAAAWRDKYPDYAGQVRNWLDEWDGQCDHFICQEHGETLAVSRFNIFDITQDKTQFAHAAPILQFCETLSGPVGIISRLSVHPGARGRGWAKALDRARIDYAKTIKLEAVIGEVKVGSHREPALGALGFRTIPGADAFPSTPFGASNNDADGKQRICCGMFLALD